MSKVQIHLDNYQGNYKPNDTIVGRVVCDFRSEQTVRAIKLRFHGFEQNKWTKKSNKHHTTFTGDNVFFYSETYLYGGESTTTMPARTYTYPFSFILPGNLPTTYEWEHGHVRFSIKAVVDKPMQFDIEDEVIYFVWSPINLNSLSRDYLDSGAWSDDKTVCCCCCTSGPIELDVSVPRRAFVPGEQINLAIRVSNLSNVSVERVSAKLKQEFTYTVTKPHTKHKNKQNILCSTTAPGIGAHGEHEFQMTLDIPNDTNLPNFAPCQLFKVEYKVKVKCHLPGCHSNLEVNVHNLQLGNIPFDSDTYISTAPSNFTPANNGYPPPAVGGPDGFEVIGEGTAGVYPPAAGYGGGGAPSAPTEMFPPSYDEAYKAGPPYPFN